MAPALEGSKPSANTRSAEVNEEESDSDFDDVEVDFSHQLTDSSAAPGTDALRDLVDKFYPIYGTAATKENMATLVILGRTGDRLIEKAQALISDPKSASAKKEYKQALQKYLDSRAGLMTMVNNRFVINGADLKNDIKLAGDPLLTPSELVQINASISPIDEYGDKVVDRPQSGTFRKRMPTEAEIEKMVSASKIDNPITGMPSGWEQISPYDVAMRDIASTLSSMYGLTDLNDLGSLSVKNMNSALMYKAKTIAGLLSPATGMVDLRPRIIDTTGNYKGTVLVATRQRDGSGPRIATDDEINQVLRTASELASNVNMPDSNGYVNPDPNSVPSTVSTNIYITQTGQEHPIHLLKGQADARTMAYASPLTGVTIFIDKTRSAQMMTDAERLSDSGKVHFSTKAKPGTLDNLTHTTLHELGHVIQFAYISDKNIREGWRAIPNRRGGDETWEKPSGLGSISGYGDSSPYEHFAESFAKYQITGEATPEFMQIMRSLGILKSQRNN